MTKLIYVKAIGDWELEVLGVPYGGPDDLDADGEYFSPSTRLHEDKYPLPAVVYYHGIAQESPEYIGKAVSFEDREEGRWYRVVLDKANEYARLVWEAAKEGLARASSGSVAHLARLAMDGHITEWPVAELSLFETGNGKEPANRHAVAVPVLKSLAEIEPALKAFIPEALGDDATDKAVKADEGTPLEEQNIMAGEKETTETTEKEPAVDVAAIAKQAAQEAAKAAADAAVKAYKDEIQKAQEAEKPVNDPGYADKGVNHLKTNDVWKYDNYSIPDLAFASEMVKSTKGIRNPDVVKAMAYRLESSEGDDKENLFNHPGSAPPLKAAKQAMKASGIKADETNFSTNAGYGDEWIGVAYSGDLWNQVRVNTFAVDRFPAASMFEFPAGAESMVIPLESTDPIWYLVAQAGDPSSSTAQVTNTVPAKAVATSNVTMTLGKLGASTIYTGEMVEGAVLPFVNQLRTQISVSGAEYLESALIDGDTATTASTNINDIAGTPASTDYFLIWNGFRKSPLVTTTANSRSAGSLTASDFLETVKLMGGAGIVGLDQGRVSFILDPLTSYKSLELPEVKTRDVNSNPTVENGRLRSIWGYQVDVSGSMHKLASNRLANTSGKVDQDTPSNNTTGSILAVRWDYWRFAFRRRMTMEVERIPRADAWEITTLMRAGLIQRDTEASAISYNVTV